MNETEYKILPKFYVLWAVAAILLTFFKDKFSNDNITHIIILLILWLSLRSFKNVTFRNPKRFFIFWGVALAALVEGAYMITKPVLPSLLVGSATTFAQFIHHYGIDLLLTVPVYYAIFRTAWWLINKYNYSKWEYIFFVALGQALGDGGGFFILQPGALLFLPYVMINYHAMNVAPFLAVRKHLEHKPGSDSRWKYLATVLALVGIYFLGGAAIKTAAKLFNLA